MEERHLSLSEVAGLLGVSERTVRRWIKAGNLQAFKPGRDYRIPESAVRAFIRESEVAPKVPPPPSQARLFNNGVEEERREAVYAPWLGFVDRYLDRWENRIDSGSFDLASVYEFIGTVEDLQEALLQANEEELRALPPQPYSHGLPAARTGVALNRLEDLCDALLEASAARFENTELEQLRRRRAEQEATLRDRDAERQHGQGVGEAG